MSQPDGFGRPSADPGRPGFARPGEGATGDPASRPTASRATASFATPTEPEPPREPARWVPVTRERRRSRTPVVLVVVVLVLAGLLVGADRLGARIAEDRFAAALQTRLQTAEPPSVQIVRTPFLSQLAAGDVREIRVRTGAVPGTATQLPLDSLDLTLDDVRPSRDLSTARVGRLTGTAHLGYGALGAKLGQTVRYAGRDQSGHGRIAFDLTTTIFSETIRATVSGRLGFSAASQAVTMSDTQITVSGLAIPGGLAQRLVNGILEPVRLDDLPLGIRLAGLDVDPDGLVAGLSGTDLTVPTR